MSSRWPGVSVSAGGHLRVHILGASGSGTSTLGRALAARLGCPHLDVDDYFWLPTDPPFQQVREAQERQALLGADIARHPTCVISGSLCGWGDIFIPLFDLVVFLAIPSEVRLARLRARERRLYGEEALAPGGRMHEIHTAFMAWAAGYDDGDLTMRSRRRHEAWLQELPCPVLPLEGVGTVAENLEAVVRMLVSWERGLPARYRGRPGWPRSQGVTARSLRGPRGSASGRTRGRRRARPPRSARPGAP